MRREPKDKISIWSFSVLQVVDYHEVHSKFVSHYFELSFQNLIIEITIMVLILYK